MKLLKIGLVVGVLIGFSFSIMACSPNYDEDVPDDFNNEEEYIPEDGEDEEDEEEFYSGVLNTFSVDDRLITEEFIHQVHQVMEAYSFEDYKTITSEEWLMLDEEDKSQVFAVYVGILTELEFPVRAEEGTWTLAMDEDADFYEEYVIWNYAFENLGLSRVDRLLSFDSYIRGIEEGKYDSLHPEILSVTDSLTVEYHTGDYLLCLGGDHDIAQITKSWTLLEPWFEASGSVTPLYTEDIFERESLDYMVNGEDGKIITAYVGEADLRSIFKAMGAMGEDGIMTHEQIQISAKASFDAPSLYVLSETALGEIKITVLHYNEDQEKYIWNNEVLTTSERCCFSKEGVFSYINSAGELCEIREEE